MNEALMQGVKETLVEAFELSFQVANTRIKSFFFHVFEVVLLDMVRQGTLDWYLRFVCEPYPLIKTFDYLFHSDAFMDALAERIDWNSALA